MSNSPPSYRDARSAGKEPTSNYPHTLLPKRETNAASLPVSPWGLPCSVHDVPPSLGNASQVLRWAMDPRVPLLTETMISLRKEGGGWGGGAALLATCPTVTKSVAVALSRPASTQPQLRSGF